MNNTPYSLTQLHNKKSAKLTSEAVQQIRKRLASGEAITSIAKDMEMSYNAIRWIQRGYSWSDLPWESEEQKQLAQQDRRRTHPCTPNKLTLNDVQHIRQELLQDVPGAVLARKYKVSRQTINQIKHGITWKEANSSAQEPSMKQIQKLIRRRWDKLGYGPLPSDDEDDQFLYVLGMIDGIAETLHLTLSDEESSALRLFAEELTQLDNY